MVGSLPEEEWVRATSCEELVDILSPAEPVGEEVNALNQSSETHTADTNSNNQITNPKGKFPDPLVVTI